MPAAATDFIPAPGADKFRKLIHDATSAIRSESSIDHYASVLNENIIALILALTVAAILGTLIAFHPRRHVESTGPASDRELRNTQIIICVAGAVMVMLIQDSLERAFGLVGLGSFVRYRTSLRNPVDLSIIFILIGLGMACGLQLYGFAITITAFMYILLFIMDFNWGGHRMVWLVKVDSTDPAKVEKVFRELAKEHNLQIGKMRSNKQAGGFRCSFIARKPVDTEELTRSIQEKCGPGVHYSRFEWQQQSE